MDGHGGRTSLYARSVAQDPNALEEPLRSAVLALLATGRVTLTSGRRSTEEQIVLRRKHCGSSHYAIYEMPSSQCSPPTARPGTSKHELGLAADLGGDLAYVESQAAALGIAQTVRGERWHWEHVNGGQGSTGAATVGLGALPPESGGGGGGGGLSALLDGHTWLRAAMVLGGVGLVYVGLVRLGADLAGVNTGSVAKLATGALT